MITYSEEKIQAIEHGVPIPAHEMWLDRIMKQGLLSLRHTMKGLLLQDPREVYGAEVFGALTIYVLRAPAS